MRGKEREERTANVYERESEMAARLWWAEAERNWRCTEDLSRRRGLDRWAREWGSVDGVEMESLM